MLNIFLALHVGLIFVLASTAIATPLSSGQIRKFENYLKAQQAQVLVLEQQAGLRLGKYRHEFNRTADQLPLAHISGRHLFQKLSEADFLLVGDDHLNPRSQLLTLRLMEKLHKTSESLTLAVEWIRPNFQRQVDRYLGGEIDLHKLRSAIQFDRHWKFSWESYSRLLSMAKKLGLRVLACGPETSISGRMHAKDQSVAALLKADRVKKGSKMRYLVPFGEYHLLGANHLHEKIEKSFPEDKTVVLLSHSTAIFQRALRLTRDLDAVKNFKMADGVYFRSLETPQRNLELYKRYLMSLSDIEHEDEIEIPKSRRLPCRLRL